MVSASQRNVWVSIILNQWLALTMLRATGPRWLDCSELCCMCNLNFNVSSPAQDDSPFSATSQPLLESLKITTATATTIPQINASTSWTRENNLTARAARFLVQFFLRSLPNDDVKFSLGTLSNHDDDEDNKVTNLHIPQRKTIVWHNLQMHFSFFCTFRVWWGKSIAASFSGCPWSVSQKLAFLANQIRGFKIPARWDDSQMNKCY